MPSLTTWSPVVATACTTYSAQACPERAGKMPLKNVFAWTRPTSTGQEERLQDAPAAEDDATKGIPGPVTELEQQLLQQLAGTSTAVPAAPPTTEIPVAASNGDAGHVHVLNCFQRYGELFTKACTEAATSAANLPHVHVNMRIYDQPPPGMIGFAWSAEPAKVRVPDSFTAGDMMALACQMSQGAFVPLAVYRKAVAKELEDATHAMPSLAQAQQHDFKVRMRDTDQLSSVVDSAMGNPLLGTAVVHNLLGSSTNPIELWISVQPHGCGVLRSACGYQLKGANAAMRTSGVRTSRATPRAASSNKANTAMRVNLSSGTSVMIVGNKAALAAAAQVGSPAGLAGLPGQLPVAQLAAAAVKRAASGTPSENGHANKRSRGEGDDEEETAEDEEPQGTGVQGFGYSEGGADEQTGLAAAGLQQLGMQLPVSLQQQLAQMQTAQQLLALPPPSQQVLQMPGGQLVTVLMPGQQQEEPKKKRKPAVKPTEEELNALLDGLLALKQAQRDTAWATIKKNAGEVLANRNNVAVKDMWRNIQIKWYKNQLSPELAAKVQRAKAKVDYPGPWPEGLQW